MIIQGVPAVIFAIGICFMPFSPRLLVNKGRDAEVIPLTTFNGNILPVSSPKIPLLGVFVLQFKLHALGADLGPSHGS